MKNVVKCVSMLFGAVIFVFGLIGVSVMAIILTPFLVLAVGVKFLIEKFLKKSLD